MVFYPRSSAFIRVFNMPVILAQLGSAFIAPALAGAGALAIGVPIAIHLLSRLRRKRENWGAMRFLRLAYQQQKNKLRLEQWLLLLTRCLLVALIGLALAGPVVGGRFAQWLGSTSGGRTIHVVVDNSLLSVVDTAELRVQPRAWVDAAGPADRVVVWATGGPHAERPLAESDPGQSREAVLRAAESPGRWFGAADWEGVISAIAEDASQRNAYSGNDVVAVISGFARSDGALEEPAPTGVGDVGGATGALQRLGDVAKVVLTRSAASQPNMQVVSVSPRRSAVLATSDDEGGEVSATVVLRRFGDTAEALPASVRVDLNELVDQASPEDRTREASDAIVKGPGLWRDGRSVGSETRGTATRGVRFGVGQDTVSVVVPVRWPSSAMDGNRDAADFGLRATLLDAQGERLSLPSEGGNDALPLDNSSEGLVRVLRRLRVGLQGGETSGDGTGLGPAVFVRSALSAGMDERSLEVLSWPADDGGALVSALGTDAERLDALMVLSPSRVSSSAWSAMGAWVRDGGVLWVWPDAAEGSGGWTSAMALGLNTETTFGPLVESDDPGRSDTAAAPRLGEAAPRALSSLAGEWEALLGPVRVSAWRPVRVGAEAQTWITLRSDASDDAAGDAIPWLVRQPLGAGTVLLLGSSLDTSWTNLPAKPLFPALMQEALRDGLAQRVPTRTFAWDERPPPGSRAPETTPSPDLVALNVQADAGDTTALNEAALSAWWDDAVGPWSFIPAAEHGGIASVLTTGAPSLPLGRYLLWAVLGLVLLESLLSRRFSHATVRSA